MRQCMLESKRSRTGCLTCRQRKLKCDEVKPECSQCRKTSRRCQPGASLVFRHQQNPSMNAKIPESVTAVGSKGFYSSRDTFDKNQTWVDIPKHLTFTTVADPYSADSDPEYYAPPMHYAPLTPEKDDGAADFARSVDGCDQDMESTTFVNGLEALSAAAAVEQLGSPSMSFVLPTGERLHANNHCSPPVEEPLSLANTDNIPNNDNNQRSSNASPELRGVNDQGRATSPPADDTQSPSAVHMEIDSEVEVGFLTRQFSESTGRWMDLFDIDCYFSHHVPVEAKSKPLLRHAVCACAAKQLGRVSAFGGVANQARRTSQINLGMSDWAWRGAVHYEKAIKLLAGEISRLCLLNNEERWNESLRLAWQLSPSNAFDFPWTPDMSVSHNGNQAHPSRDDILTAAAILCMYEFLDNATTAWTQHLRGVKGLFDLFQSIDVSEINISEMSSNFQHSRARRATFWNFARQDFLAAFVNETQTRRDAMELSNWCETGLLLDCQGLVSLRDSTVEHLPLREDAISNLLISILAKIVNYLAVGDSVDNVFPQDPSSPTSLLGFNQMTLLGNWQQLERELDEWSQELPDTFTPCARLPANRNPDAVFPEIWFSIPMCASTMQSYHMARILLLVNRPQESTAKRATIYSRLHSYRYIDAEVRYHSQEICGIALSRPEPSSRIHMVQPLFVAGQCLDDIRERQVILELLRDVEKELGWATEYYVQQLLLQWSWTNIELG